MKTIVAAVLAVGALTALGCDDKDKKTEAKPEAKPAATATAKAAAPAPAKSAAPGGGW